jgi:hypothetical protein
LIDKLELNNNPARQSIYLLFIIVIIFLLLYFRNHNESSDTKQLREQACNSQLRHFASLGIAQPVRVLMRDSAA